MTAAVTVQGPNGLGKRETDLTASDLQRYQQVKHLTIRHLPFLVIR